MGFGGLGFGVWGLGFGVWGLGFGVWGLGFAVLGLKKGLGFGMFRVVEAPFRAFPGLQGLGLGDKRLSKLKV